MDPTIQNWMSRVERKEELTLILLTCQERTCYLPLFFDDLLRRLRLAANAKVAITSTARQHGVLRYMQGYTVSMMVEELRILQVSLFSTCRTI